MHPRHAALATVVAVLVTALPAPTTFAQRGHSGHAAVALSADGRMRQPRGSVSKCYSLLAPEGTRWVEAEPFTINETNSPTGLTGMATDLVNQAVGVWETAAETDIIGAGTRDDGRDAIIGASDGANAVDFGVIDPQYGPALAIAWIFWTTYPDGTGTIDEFDVRFSTDVDWSAEPPLGEEYRDFLSTAIHEIGHAMGLDHARPIRKCESEAMYPSVTGLTRTLGIGDITGINVVY